MNRHRLPLLSLLLLALALGACSSELSNAPRSWIDAPLRGRPVQAGAEVPVEAHHYVPGGVVEVVLSVNGVPYRRDAPQKANGDLAFSRQIWQPPAPGIYLLEVQALGKGGVTGAPATVRVEAVAAAALTPLPATVTRPAATPTSPTATSSPTATPTATATLAATATFTPTPTPGDTTPPPAPQPMVPADGLQLSCRARQTLVWLPVSDPSGIAGYDVLLEYEVTPGVWKTAATWGLAQGKQVTAEVQCGVRYRWQVRAYDGAGNPSPWSDLAHFAVALQ